MCECELVEISDCTRCVAADEDNEIVLGVQCSSDAVCPLPHLFTLRHRYHHALEDLEQAIERFNPVAGNESARVLDMAKFVKQVTEQHSASISGIWGESTIGSGCMRGCYRSASASADPLCRSCTRYVRNDPGRACGCSDLAENFDRSYLRQYIWFREQAIIDRREAAEAAAEELINYLTRPDVQNHLWDHHRQEFPDDSNVPYICHGIQHWSRGDQDRPWLRESDHVLACLTVRLDAVEPGREFLNHCIDEQYMVSHRDNYKVIKDSWDFFTGSVKASPAIGRFFSNVTPAIVMRIRGLVVRELSRQLIRAHDPIARVIGHARVRSALSFLDDKFDVDVTAIVREQANEYGRRSGQFIELANTRRELERAMHVWDDAQPSTTAAKLEGMGFRVSFSVIAFGLSMAKLLKDWERQNVKDWLSVIGGAAGVAETMTTEISNGVQRVAGQPGLTSAAQLAAFGLSRLALVIQVVTASMDIAQNMDSGDYDEAGVAAAALAVGFTGSVAGMITTFGPGMGLAAATLSIASTVAAVCIVVALALVVVMILITDHPLVDYLEKTHWGRPGISGRYSVADTVDRYYSDLYQPHFTVRFVNTGPGDPHLEVRSSFINDRVPVEVRISRARRVTGSVRIMPVLASGERYVLTHAGERRCRVHCVATPMASGGREIQIYNCEQLFELSGSARSHRYRVEARMDPDIDGEYELTTRTDNVQFVGT